MHPATAPRPRGDDAPPRLPAEAGVVIAEGRDWHNDYASFVLDLQDSLRAGADDRARRVLLRRLKRALTSDA